MGRVILRLLQSTLFHLMLYCGSPVWEKQAFVDGCVNGVIVLKLFTLFFKEPRVYIRPGWNYEDREINV
jgi:hypothetical protein